MSTVSVIDVGSNAIRLVIAKKNANGYEVLYKKREPIRLGQDAFEQGFIGDKLIEQTCDAFKKFKKAAKKHDSSAIIAIGTSALRNAKNKNAVLGAIVESSDIKIDIIDGDKEASLAFQAIESTVDLKQKNSLLIDIGGGSVELITVKQGVRHNCKSFPVGTVRLLQKLREDKPHKIAVSVGELLNEALLHTENQNLAFDFCVGIGGNFERILRLQSTFSESTNEAKLDLVTIKQMYDVVASYSVGKRIKVFDLRPDQADVIIPALATIIHLMEASKCETLYIPGVGIKDSLIMSYFQLSQASQ